MKNKKLLALFFIISVLICCSISYASSEETLSESGGIDNNDFTLTFEVINHDNLSYIKGEKIQLEITSTIENLEKYRGKTFTYVIGYDKEIKNNDKYSYTITVNKEENNVTFEQDNNVYTTNGYGCTQEGDQKIKIMFKWIIDVTDFIDMLKQSGSNSSNMNKRIGIFLKCNDDIIIQDWSDAIIIINDIIDIYPPTIKTLPENIHGWIKEESVSITQFIKPSGIEKIEEYKYRLTGATESNEQTAPANGILQPTITIENEGITTITISCKEKREPEARDIPEGEYLIKIDRTAPKIEIGELQSGFVKIEISDPAPENVNDVSGIDTRNVKYLLTQTQIKGELTEDNIKSNGNLQSFTNGYKVSLLGTSGPNYLYVIAKDKAGNCAIAEKEYMINRGDKPTITFEPTSNNDEWKQSLDVTINITDSNGIKKDNIKYLWNESTTQLNKDDFNSGNGLSNSSDISNGITATISSPSGKDMEGSYYLWIYAEDNYGNYTISHSEPYNIDNVKPTVDVSNDNLYRPKHEEDVTFTDKGSGINPETLKYFWDTTEIDINSEDINTKFDNNGKQFTNGGLVSTPEGIENGNYFLYLQGSDFAENTTTFRSTDTYKIDNTEPEIKIMINSKEGDLKNSIITATVTDVDSNIAEKKYYWTTNPIEQPVISDMILFESSTINLPESDGIYYLWIYALNNADLSAYEKSDKFVYDTTSPAQPTIIVKEKGSDLAISDRSHVNRTCHIRNKSRRR